MTHDFVLIDSESGTFNPTVAILTDVKSVDDLKERVMKAIENHLDLSFGEDLKLKSRFTGKMFDWLAMDDESTKITVETEDTEVTFEIYLSTRF